MNYSIGIIIGGTNTSIGLIDDLGNIVLKKQLKTNTKISFEYFSNQMIEEILNIVLDSNLNQKIIHGIGIGCTGPVDRNSGKVVTDFTLPGWGGYSLIDPFQKYFQVPVIVENNVDASVYGEYFLEERKPSTILLLTFGTGVGGGVVDNGKIYRGANGEHPEIGHIPVRTYGPDCYCGIKGCLEMAASGTAIEAEGKKVGIESSSEVFIKAAEGHEAATKIVEEVWEYISLGLWTLLHTFMPDTIVLGGGVMEGQYQKIYPLLKKLINSSTLTPKGKIELRKAHPGNDAGIVGAAMLSIKNI